MKIGVISDTHDYLNPKVFDIFKGVDLIIHCGDICKPEIIIELETIAYVQAVSGNMDDYEIKSKYPISSKVDTPAGVLCFTHGHMYDVNFGRTDSITNAFKHLYPKIIVFGHTHEALCKKEDEIILFNPGSAKASSQSDASVGLLSIDENKIKPEIIYL